MGHARALINLETEEQQLDIMQQIIDRELSVRQVEAMVNEIKNPTPIKNKSKEVSKKSLPETHFEFKTKLSCFKSTILSTTSYIAILSPS